MFDTTGDRVIELYYWHMPNGYKITIFIQKINLFLNLKRCFLEHPRATSSKPCLQERPAIHEPTIRD